MNGASALNATSASNLMRRIASLIGLGVLLTLPAVAQQGGTAAMAQVKEVLLQFANFGNTKASGECGLSRESLSDELQRTLKLGSVPFIPINEAKPAMMGVARIDLLPEVITVYNEGLGCTSWVSLAAQSKASVRIPPVELPRSVTISYWRGGQMISSNQTSHPRLVIEAIQKLAKQFSEQYRLDQPPPLPNFDDPAPVRTPNKP